MSTAVIQSAFLGDCVLTLPFLKRLGELYPGEKIYLIAAGAGAELFELALKRGLSPLSAQVEVLRFEKRGADAGPLGLWRVARRFAGADRVFCLQRSFRSGLLAYLSGSSRRVGFSSGAASFFYTVFARREWSGGQSEIEKNLDLLRAEFGGKGSVSPWISEAAPSLLRAAPAESLSSPRVVISLGSPWPTKRWPARHAAALVQKLVKNGVEVSLVGDLSAKPLAEIVRSANPSLLVKDLCGQTSIRQWVDIIASASLVLSGDSAAVHVASDVGVPVVALFGPTLPDFGFAPWRKNSHALGVMHLPCRPCHIHGPKRCPLGHHRCLEDLTSDLVWQDIESLLPSFI